MDGHAPHRIRCCGSCIIRASGLCAGGGWAAGGPARRRAQGAVVSDAHAGRSASTGGPTLTQQCELRRLPSTTLPLPPRMREERRGQDLLRRGKGQGRGSGHTSNSGGRTSPLWRAASTSEEPTSERNKEGVSAGASGTSVPAEGRARTHHARRGSRARRAHRAVSSPPVESPSVAATRPVAQRCQHLASRELPEPGEGGARFERSRLRSSMGWRRRREAVGRRCEGP